MQKAPCLRIFWYFILWFNLVSTVLHVGARDMLAYIFIVTSLWLLSYEMDWNHKALQFFISVPSVQLDTHANFNRGINIHKMIFLSFTMFVPALILIWPFTVRSSLLMAATVTNHCQIIGFTRKNFCCSILRHSFNLTQHLLVCMS